MRHHPLVSPIAIWGALILLVGLGLIITIKGGQLFSPGELSAISASNKLAGGFKNHADFGNDCLTCHTAFAGVEFEKCTACHTEIGHQQTLKQGLHGQIGSEVCTTCHQEHQGAAVDLLADAINQFSADMHATRFVLDGAHAAITCTSCHGDNQYTNTPNTCHGCHVEPMVHAGQFGSTCTNCHSTTKWPDAQLLVHAFPLDHGLLGQLACETCHVTIYTEFVCTACHTPGFEDRFMEVVEAR